MTFLFTDIEGSTKLLNQLGDGYPVILEQHQRLLREAFASGDGVEISTEGDSFFVVFPRAPQAVAAAVAGQRALAEHLWPDGTSVKVRMGLHTGEGRLAADDYVGLDVHRAARIGAAGHGGQILLSGATRALVEQALPEGVSLRDLGEHRLKDLVHPERLYQVVAEGLESDFRPPKTLDARPTNLPQQLTSFVGRQRELDDVKEALQRTRLLTLTGPGGTGKTRLSLQVAADLLARYEDGAFFVPLAPITDPSLVIPTIAEVLGLHEEARRPTIEVLVEHLADKDLLLVLDNFEQVVDAAPQVGELLSLTSRTRLLVTSREPLGVHGEHEYPVPPLGVPDPARLPPLGSLSQFEAVSLFLERARAVNPRFEVDEDNAPAVAEITARLDGLPLAIELAAARSKLLTPQAMLKRLGHRLTLLAGGRRDLPGRQQTLRDAIAWSYDLLDDDEARLFVRLSVFVGGFGLEAVDAVCDPDGSLTPDAFEAVASLVNKSLLRRIEGPAGEARFFMLETIREYAMERLEERAEGDDLRRRHAEHFRALAESAAPLLTGERQAEWLEVLAAEHDNLRAAFDWAVERTDAELAFRIGAPLWRFWQFRGHLREARGRLERALALLGGPADARADALEAAGGVAYWTGDFKAAQAFYEACLELRRQVGDVRRVAEALYNLSFIFHVPKGVVDLDRGRQLLEESHELFAEIGDRRGQANVSWAMANVYIRLGERERAEAAARDSLDANRALGDRFGIGWSLHTLAALLITRGETDEAGRHLQGALEIFMDAGDLSGIALLLADFAAAALEDGDEDRAARLAGAAFTQAAASGIDLGLAAFVLEGIFAAREELARRPAYGEGEALSVEHAVAYALGHEPAARSGS
ncbi:MAG TPA: adenylate/guanylate cyclase domain-containing protein [Actinomycetota bacterium]|nr:adenylate/guanylate cyclase domain-containing protein [Actinomycetota bacterium]